MFLLIKNAHVYAPKDLGRQDVLACGSSIAAIEARIDAAALPGKATVIDAEGALLVPGFIDCHVHVTGGGGEGGFSTRTPELQASTCFRSGVTSVVGTLGTDGLTRSMENLVAKTYGLREDGLSAWCLTGSYRVPPRTVTGDAMKDIMMVEPVIGVGETAISDHRSSLASFAELGRLASEARLGGMLAGKAGIVNFHIGDAPAALEPLARLTASGEMPKSQFLPTHCNRSEAVFASALEWALSGGFVDLTTSSVPRFIEEGELTPATAIKRLLAAGIPIERITCSSDGQGSLPLFDDSGAFAGLSIGSSASLWEALRRAILGEGLGLEAALKPVTTNPAAILKLAGKGRIEVGADADLVILEAGDYRLRSTVSRGRLAFDRGGFLLKGRFEA
jgi:beta-aspartyl-dipeptidase (metallo-type)